MFTWTLLDYFPVVQVAVFVGAWLFALVTYRYPPVGATLALVVVILLGGIFLLTLLGLLRSNPDETMAQLKMLIDPRIIQAVGFGTAFFLVPQFFVLRIKDQARREGYDEGFRKGYDKGLQEGYEKGLREGRQAA
jgi:hypothetical protein